jgi:N-acetylneuraminic acid mutarotase
MRLMAIEALIRRGIRTRAWRAGFIALFLLCTCPAVWAQLGKNWAEATTDGKWSPRRLHTSVVLGGRIWVIGGTQSGLPVVVNDVWYSSDGSHWTSATLSAAWSPRLGHTSVVYNGKIWVIGGLEGDPTRDLKNDVWSSSDGISWASATLSAPWSPRDGHASVVFDGKMWVMGGVVDTYPYSKNDVWYSSDGAHWTSATLSAKWPPRSWHSSTVHDGKMWVIGGSDVGTGDVWYSTDGVTWTSATLSAPWGPRSGHTVVAYDGRIWLIGGTQPGHGTTKEVWCSSDGKNWTLVTNSAPWGDRCNHTSVLHNERIWLLGGYYYFPLQEGYKNDVWYTLSGTGARGWWRY